MKVLITGGTGYIGSHTAVELINDNIEIVILDNLSNSKASVLDSICKITGIKPKFYKLDLLDKSGLEQVFAHENFTDVIHFAGLKAVGESVKVPLKYYQNNIAGTLNLLECMQKYNVNNMVFSSSATVYGDPITVPITEDFALSATNPYGQTKLFIEQILKDMCKANPLLNVALLRYFNPIGAHSSGLIGEDPNGIPNNLLPYISQVAIGKLKELNIFGNDYPTKDGTGVRDYIHVVDLARGHLKALSKLNTNSGLVIYNLGTGNGYSVLEIVEAFKRVSMREVKYRITDRRKGDIAVCFADCTKAKTELNFSCLYNLDDMCLDSWRFQQMENERNKTH